MPLCFVPSCKNRTDTRYWKKDSNAHRKRKLTFHRFPKNPNVRLWLDILNIDSSSIPREARICSDHFSEESFDKSSTASIRLKPNTLPIRIFEITSPASASSVDTEECSNDPVPVTKVGRATSPMPQATTFTHRATSPIRIVSTSQPSTSKEDKETMVTPEFVYNSPEKSRLRKRIENIHEEYKKKIRTLQQSLRRSTDRITTLKSTLDILKQKNLLNDEQVDVLHTIGGSNALLFDRLMKKSNKEHVSREYDPQLRSFALTLHYYSPRAYDYLRNKLDCCLPHPKTISKWYGSIEGNPGICSEALKSIEQRAKNTTYPLLGALIFDEMAIRQHLEYDGSKFSGYVDMGKDIVCDDTVLANEALVFMVVCINSGWKIPIAYYLIHGMTADLKANLVSQCITALHGVGLKIVSLTCDGTTTNFSVFKNLGCNFDKFDSLQTSFPHPVTNERTIAFLDPSHMTKLVRNVFNDMQALLDGLNHEVLWYYLIELNKLQEKENMHLGNKLRNSHIHFKKQKMKVRLATQVFSKSVADSLEFCRSILKLKSFELCGATIQFLIMFNDLFDILNSKNNKQAGFKKALNEQNFQYVKSRFDEIRKYILSLKSKAGELVLESRKRTEFLGFLICIESALVLYEEHCEKNKLLKYIPFYKLSQDHVELLFGCIRAHGGGNNNPTVRQFKAAMKKILIHADVRETSSRNCVPLEHISILHVSSAKSNQPENIINSTTRLSYLYNEFHMSDNDAVQDITHIIDDHQYIQDCRAITEFSKNVIEYIAGYVVMQLLKILHCEDCRNALKEIHPREKNLIKIKSCGGLIQPSTDVIKICMKCESIIRCHMHMSGELQLKKEYNEPYLSNKVLRSLIDVNLFEQLNEHTNDQAGLENHAVHLVRAIVKKYTKIRLHYLALSMIDKSKSRRHHLNKSLLFTGQ